jgi:hypothetical protein
VVSVAAVAAVVFSGFGGFGGCGGLQWLRWLWCSSVATMAAVFFGGYGGLQWLSLVCASVCVFGMSVFGALQWVGSDPVYLFAVESL